MLANSLSQENVAPITVDLDEGSVNVGCQLLVLARHSGYECLACSLACSSCWD